jgi:hypothetical protein
VWNNTAAEQLFEFSAPREVCRCVVFHPVAHVIACGFDNGFVRVFDVPTTRWGLAWTVVIASCSYWVMSSGV